MDLSFINKFGNVKLLVVGEVGIDEYIWGNTTRISPEAPVPVVEVESQSLKLGLAGNVAQNLTSLGVNTSLISVCGEDRDSERLQSMLKDSGVGKMHFISDPSRPTLRKTRIIAQRQHVVRVDYERSHGLDAKLAKQFESKICDELSNVDGIIVQDYGKGIFNPDTMRFVKDAKQKNKPVFVDPSRMSPLSLYQGVTLLTPNTVEAETLCKVVPDRKMPAGKNDERLLGMAKQILAETQADHSIITCGEWGMVSVSNSENTLTRIPTFARDVFDVTGAGDTVIAVLSLMYCLGFSLSECMHVANAAAGIVVGRIGASAITPVELKAELERLQENRVIN